MIPDNYKELNYNQLLLKHLDRISHLATVIPMEMVNGQFIHNTEKDKRMALKWSALLLVKIIPSELKDKNYIQTVNNLYRKKDASVGEDFSVIGESVNLLARQGMLLEKEAIPTIRRKKDIAKEKMDMVFEDD